MGTTLFERINGLAGHHRLLDDSVLLLARFGPYLIIATAVLRLARRLRLA
jgi:hypothetical protein